MPTSFNRIQDASTALSEQEALEQLSQETQRVQSLLSDMGKEGQGLAWIDGKWCIVDTPGINEVYDQAVSEQERQVLMAGSTALLIRYEVVSPDEQEQQEQKRKLPDVPNVMHNDNSFTELSNHVVHATLTSLHSAQSNLEQEWHRGERLPTFMYKKDGGIVFVSLRPQGKGPADDSMLTELEVAQAWAPLTGMGGVMRVTSRTGIVLQALVTQALDAPPDASGNRWITAEQILEYRKREKVTKEGDGGERRTAGHRTEDIEEIGKEIRHLENTWVQLDVKIIDDTDTRGRKRHREYSHQSKLIAISSVIMQKEVTPDSTSTMPVAWAFTLGTWAEPFLRGANRFTAQLPQQCFAYDHYREPWELRLSEYCVRKLRLDAKKGPTVTLQIDPLLKELSLPIDRDHPSETRKNFERAMNRLVNDGVISAWRYKDGEPKLKRYGWLIDWLSLDIEFTSTEGTKQQYKQIAERSETRRQRAEALDAANKAKRTRKEGRSK